MFIHHALDQVASADTLLRALDLCAAPGGKSTLLAGFLPPGSLLVANEVIRQRVKVLRENMEKWGAVNVAITQADPEEYRQLPGWFDLVLVDAPCSGEGLFRKDPAAIQEWSPEHVEFCYGRQRRILSAAVETLRPGGVLLYSTCTYNPWENDGIVQWMLESFSLEKMDIPIPAEWNIVSSGSGYHFYPHRVRGEGFFLSILRKKDGPAPKLNTPGTFKTLKALPRALRADTYPWVNAEDGLAFWQIPTGEILFFPEQLEPDFLMLDKFLKARWFGTLLGEFKGKSLIPAHALAMSTSVQPQLSAVALDKEQALLYLKKENPGVPDSAPRGWVMARYAGLNLGWMKIMPNRINNYLPQERRIRMDLPLLSD
jgi:NOL1/NOP2/fmu family ribosome biogenesis protein